MVKAMDRRAADNKYLHRDFHVSADAGIAYVGRLWGDDAVKEYLKRFTLSWYSPLINEIKNRGLAALKEHIEKIYETEETRDVLHITMSENPAGPAGNSPPGNFPAGELSVNIDRCPAVTYMRSIGHEPSQWYPWLTLVVNKTIAEKSGIGFEMISYDEDTGKAAYRFFTKPGNTNGGMN